MGEWKTQNTCVVEVENGEIQTVIAWCDSTERAELIAALPDLLEACKAFVEAHEKSLQLEKTDVALRKAKAAIAKAERINNDSHLSL